MNPIDFSDALHYNKTNDAQQVFCDIRKDSYLHMLDAWTTFHDPATLRRELYNKHLLDRTVDCKSYWKEEDIPAVADFIARYL